MQSKLITVIGATGFQGGSVVCALLKDNQWKIRAVTRDARSEKAKELKDKGVEVVECDITEKSCGHHIFKDSYGAFLVTDHYDKSMKGKEMEVGMRLVEAARKAGVQHLIWSSLPNVQRLSKGKYNVPTFTNKGLVEEQIRVLQNSPTPAFPYATYFGPSFYYQNFLNIFPPKREGDLLVFTLPDTSSIKMFDVKDSGNVVAEILRRPLETNGKFIAAYSFQGKMSEAFDIMKNQKHGDKIKVQLVPTDEFAKGKHEHAELLAQMFAWFNEFGFYGPEISTDVKQLGVHLTPFDEWIKNHYRVELEKLE